jgi:replicative DNA helicase
MREFELLSEQVEGLKHFAANPKQRIRTGIDSLDKLTRGPAPGEVYTILGRSYAGKSLVAQNIMLANTDKGGVFFSLEMPSLMAVQRMFSMWSGLSSQEVQQAVQENRITPLWDSMAEELERHVIVDRAALSTWEMGRTLSEYEAEFGERPDFVIVDYLELVSGAKNSGEGWLQTESQAQQIKDFAKSEKIAVFLLHQTNKTEPEWEPPTMGSARGGGYTESDFVVGMWRPYLDPKLSWLEAESIRTEISFTILKNRPFGAHNNNDIRCRLTGSLKIEEVV